MAGLREFSYVQILSGESIQANNRFNSIIYFSLVSTKIKIRLILPNILRTYFNKYYYTSYGTVFMHYR